MFTFYMKALHISMNVSLHLKDFILLLAYVLSINLSFDQFKTYGVRILVYWRSDPHK